MKKYILLIAFLIASSKSNAVSRNYTGIPYKIGTDYEILEIADNEDDRNVILNANNQLLTVWDKTRGFEKINGIPVLNNAQLNYLEKTKNKKYSNQEKLNLTRKYIEFYLSRPISYDDEIAENIARFVDNQELVILDATAILLHILNIGQRVELEER